MASSNDHWNTPPELLGLVRELFGGPIELDPFCNPTAVVHAEEQWAGPDAESDTLDDRWNLDGFEEQWIQLNTFVNGPWSRAGDVAQKCHREWSKNMAQIIQVTPTSLNAKYWELVEAAPAVCVPRKRISFMRDGEPVKGNRQDCVVVYWGSDIYRFRAIFGDLGRVRFG